jgi:hypothetical protein
MSGEEIKKYLASIGSKGGKSGTGKSKLRGGKSYYKRISTLAAQARKAKARRKVTPKTTNDNLRTK